MDNAISLDEKVPQQNFNVDGLPLNVSIQNDTVYAKNNEIKVEFIGALNRVVSIDEIDTIKFRNHTYVLIDVRLKDGTSYEMINAKVRKSNSIMKQMETNFNEKNGLLRFFTYNSYAEGIFEVTKTLFSQLDKDTEKITKYIFKQARKEREELNRLRKLST
jgi:hypothetical protein